MNRGQIRLRVIRALREQSVPVGWTEPEINRYIDDEYREIAEQTGAVVETVTIAVQPKTVFVPLPSNCLYPLAVKDVTSGYPIRPVHWTVIDGFDARWIDKFRGRPNWWAPFGLHEFIIWPAYSADSNIEMMMAAVPADFANDSELPNLPEEYHVGIMHKVVSRCIVKHAQDGPRIGRSLRHDKKAEESLSGLEDWTTERHENIHLANYGTPMSADAGLPAG